MEMLGDHFMMNGQMQGGIDQSGFYGGSVGDQNVVLENALYSVSKEGEDLRDLGKSKRKLAKRANEIYRSLCTEFELGECFFSGFGAWSEFVEGRISETSFYEKAKEEAHLIANKGD